MPLSRMTWVVPHQKCTEKPLYQDSLEGQYLDNVGVPHVVPSLQEMQKSGTCDNCITGIITRTSSDLAGNVLIEGRHYHVALSQVRCTQLSIWDPWRHRTNSHSWNTPLHTTIATKQPCTTTLVSYSVGGAWFQKFRWRLGRWCEPGQWCIRHWCRQCCCMGVMIGLLWTQSWSYCKGFTIKLRLGFWGRRIGASGGRVGNFPRQMRH